MRTDEEILARIEAVKDQDWLLGTQTEDLVIRLPFEKAKPWLRDEVVEEKWESAPRDPDAIRAIIRDYMPFAWDKANGCRGISAGRSLQHMSAWLWLMGYTAAADQILDYDHYGKPWLRAICDEFGWDWRQWDDERWRQNELADGTSPPETVTPLAKDVQ